MARRWRLCSKSIATGSGAWWNCVSTPGFEPRLDASYVVQEAFLEVARDLDAYLADPKLPRCSGCAWMSNGG